MTRQVQLALAAAGALLVAGGAGALLLKIGDQRRQLVAEEAGRLKAEGHLVAEKARGSDLHAANEELEATVQHLLDSEPGAKVVERLVIRTAPGTITAPPEERAKVEATGDGTARPAEAACALREGQDGQILLEAVRVDTAKGNRVLKARGSFWRVRPAPEFKVYEQELEADLSSYFTTEGAPAAPRVTRWAARALYGTDGLGVGVERRLIGPVWIGLEAGRGRAAVALRVEF